MDKEKRKPEPVFEMRLGALKLTIWKQRGDDNSLFHGATLTKSWKDDKTGEWHDTQYFSQYDLADIAALVSRAQTHLIEVKEIKRSGGKSPMTKACENELDRITGQKETEETRRFRENYLSAALKKIGIEKSFYRASEEDKALLFASLKAYPAEKETNEGPF